MKVKDLIVNEGLFTGCIKKLYTLGFELISQLKIHFKQRFCTFSICQTRTVTKNVQIFIPATKSDQDIEFFVKDVKKKMNKITVYSPVFSLW
jgi:hypothetical protein